MTKLTDGAPLPDGPGGGLPEADSGFDSKPVPAGVSGSRPGCGPEPACNVPADAEDASPQFDAVSAADVGGAFPQADAASAADGGLAGLAEDDASLAEAAGAREVDAQAPLERRAAVLAEAVARHPLNREVLYRILSYCFEERPLGDIEREVASWPEFKGATQNPCHMVSTLVRFGGLVAIERDEAGLLVAPERKEGLSEDEADDLVWEVSYLATDAGRRVVEEHSPAGRMQGLFAGAGERAGAYADVLAFVADAPRSYPEIASFLRGRPELETVIDGVRETMQPSVFVDKLERAGALVWKEKWELTEEGREFLAKLG